VQAIVNPELFRDYYAHHPSGAWSGVDSTDAHTRQVRFTNLVPGQPYLFAVIALDRAGDYSPDFNLEANMLQFVPGYPRTPPTVSTARDPRAGIELPYPQGGFCDCRRPRFPRRCGPGST
jgi:hypothetical protein